MPVRLFTRTDAFQDAQVNALTTRLPNASTKMFLMHAVYGLGATLAPLVSTQFVKRIPTRFYLYFCVSVGLGLATAMALILVFQGRTDDQVVGRRQPDPVTVNRVNQQELSSVANREKDSIPPDSGGSGKKMKAIMRMPAMHYMAFYIFIYVSLRWLALGMC